MGLNSDFQSLATTARQLDIKAFKARLLGVRVAANLHVLYKQKQEGLRSV